MPDIAGLKLIVPTSVAGSGVSVSASGQVTFTAATSVNVNGCFTSSYDNYIIVCQQAASAEANLLFRLRVSGTDATGSNYVFQGLNAISTTVSASRNTYDHTIIGTQGNTLRNGQHFYVYGPALAQPTAMRSVIASSYQSATITDGASTHSLSTAYDGFTVYMASGNATGTLTVYGLSQ
jgi:hypothetical protein